VGHVDEGVSGQRIIRRTVSLEYSGAGLVDDVPDDCVAVARRCTTAVQVHGRVQAVLILLSATLLLLLHTSIPSMLFAPNTVLRSISALSAGPKLGSLKTTIPPWAVPTVFSKITTLLDPITRIPLADAVAGAKTLSIIELRVIWPVAPNPICIPFSAAPSVGP